MDITTIDISELWELIMRMHHCLWELGRESWSRDKKIDHLSVAQIKVILLLANHSPMSMMLKSLAHDLHVTPGAMSQTVDGLCKLGFVEREADPNDRRAVAIRLADAGQKNVELVRARLKALLLVALKKIPPQTDIAVGMEFLRSLTEKLEELPANAVKGSHLTENSHPQ